MKHRIVFLGSKKIGAQCLQYLLDALATLQMEVIAVRTQARPHLDGEISVENIAREHNIPLLASLDEMPSCDIIYSVQHHEILQEQHIAKASIRALNLHLAPLPEYRGCNQFSFAIMNEEQHFGVSIHAIDTKIDHGTLYFEDRFPIAGDIWVDELHHLANDKGFLLFKDTLPNITSPELMAIDTTGRASKFYLRKDIEQLKKIDLSSPQSIINKQIRATSMPGFEPPYFFINNTKIHCYKSTSEHLKD